MRFSKLLSKTSMSAPHDADSVNAKLLTQGGFIDKLAAGVYNFLPLGLRVLHKIHNIIREEMNAIDGQEILMPSLHPIDIWKTTGRDKSMEDILFTSKGAGDKDFVFGPSHEETVTPLAGKFIRSYKDLPVSVYQIQTKFRNEPRTKSGILRGREFIMKDMYSFHKDEKSLDEYYDKVLDAYLRVYERCSLKAHVVQASGGAFSKNLSHEFSIETKAGEDTILVCKKCGFAQNIEVAEGKVVDDNVPLEEEKEFEVVKALRGKSVVDNAKFHNVGLEKILKTVVYAYDGGFVGVLIRGDLNVNEDKLSNFLNKKVRPASRKEIKELGLVEGYISPVKVAKVEGGVKHGAEVRSESFVSELEFIADYSIKNVKNFVTGGNEEGVDFVNVNLGRDFVVETFGDFVLVKDGFKCPKCGGELDEITAIEAGNIFKLGTKYSDAFNLKFTDEDGKQKPVVMGCYGIGTTRLLGTIVEWHHDDKGIVWPMAVAPYHVHLLYLGKSEEVIEKANFIYEDFKRVGIEVLFDDRNESAGKKLNDADLIGIPIRVLISDRTLKEDEVEFKLRSEDKGVNVKINELKDKVISLIFK